MGNAPWQKRVKAVGLTQKVLARLLGRAENTVSRQLAGKWEGGVIPQNTWAAILAWEIMTPEQRLTWITAVEAELPRREKAAPLIKPR